MRTYNQIKCIPWTTRRKSTIIQQKDPRWMPRNTFAMTSQYLNVFEIRKTLYSGTPFEFFFDDLVTCAVLRVVRWDPYINVMSASPSLIMINLSYMLGPYLGVLMSSSPCYNANACLSVTRTALKKKDDCKQTNKHVKEALSLNF